MDSVVTQEKSQALIPRRMPSAVMKLDFNEASSSSAEEFENQTKNTLNLFSKILVEDAERCRLKYDFDIEKERPVSNPTRWEYTLLSKKDHVPDFYLKTYSPVKKVLGVRSSSAVAIKSGARRRLVFNDQPRKRQLLIQDLLPKRKKLGERDTKPI